MSSKKNQKKHTKQKSQNHNPSIWVPKRKVVPLDVLLERVYSKEDLSTTCLRQCTCCRVACPQMKFCEASSIIDFVWANGTKEDKKKILVGAVKYYFSDSLIKPCLLLKGETCSVYSRRPLNCRLYGLWPEDSWKERVAMFAKSTGLPIEKLPLNTQCPNVRRKPQVCKACQGTGKLYDLSKPNDPTYPIGKCDCCGGTGKIQPLPFTSEQITALFGELDKVDGILGISELKVATSWNYRTFHDWVLLKFWGESVLSKWTNIILTTTPEQRQGIMEAFEEQADSLL